MPSPSPTSAAADAPSANEPMNPGDESPARTPGTAENICPDCGGSGKQGTSDCTRCGGSGKVIVNVGDA